MSLYIINDIISANWVTNYNERRYQ